MTADPTGLETGDTILDAGKTGLRSVQSISRRLPWAVVKKAAILTDTVIQVDNTDGDEILFRPAFDTVTFPLRLVVIQDRDGTFLVSDVAPVEVSGKTSTSLTFSAPIGVNVPVGATIRHILYNHPFVVPPVVPYLKSYRLGFDVGVDLKEGLLKHVQPFPPFDGSIPGIPAELEIQNPSAGEILDVNVFSATAPSLF